MKKKYALQDAVCEQCKSHFQVERYLANKYKFCSTRCAYDNLRKPAIERFMAKIDKSDKCWNWTGAKGRGGYGIFTVEKRNVIAHRYAYLIWRGEIPTGLLVCHHCDNRACVNPNHLFLGTHKDNTQDMLRKGRCNPPSGERQGNHKLTSEQVIAIRASTDSQTVAARQFGISQSAVSLLRSNKRWKYAKKKFIAANSIPV